MRAAIWRWGVWAAVGGMMALAPPVAAQSDDGKDTAAPAPDAEADAQALAGAAREAFSQERYQEALEGFLSAYALSGKPDLLYNVAVCHDKLGHREEARTALRAYLDAAPDAPDADAVRALLRRWEASPAPSRVPSGEETPAAPASGPTPAGSAPPLSASQEVATDAQEGTEGPVPSAPGAIPRGPVVLWATGGLVGGIGLLVGLSAITKYRGYKDVCAPDCSADAVRSVRGRAVAADVLVTAGIATAAVGLVWWLRERRNKVVAGRASCAWRAGRTQCGWVW